MIDEVSLMDGLVKISVVVPVYNPGEGIKRCLECLQKQTLNDIEMIFIDDCGEDRSAIHIIEEAKKMIKE